MGDVTTVGGLDPYTLGVRSTGYLGRGGVGGKAREVVAQNREKGNTYERKCCAKKGGLRMRDNIKKRGKLRRCKQAECEGNLCRLRVIIRANLTAAYTQLLDARKRKSCCTCGGRVPNSEVGGRPRGGYTIMERTRDAAISSLKPHHETLRGKGSDLPSFVRAWVL